MAVLAPMPSPSVSATTAVNAGARPSVRVDNADFDSRSLNGNAVLRWEYRPGSTMFFVWTQQRSGDSSFGDFDFSRDSRALLLAQAQVALVPGASAEALATAAGRLQTRVAERRDDAQAWGVLAQVWERSGQRPARRPGPRAIRTRSSSSRWRSPPAT